MPIMGGWKTWLAVVGNLALAAYNFIQGNTEIGVTFLTAALALLGIGHKIEKSSQK